MRSREANTSLNGIVCGKSNSRETVRFPRVA